MGEFELIRAYFSRPVKRARLGAGDDCALLAARAGYDWAVSTDMLVEGRHFLHGTDPWRLGWKCLAVNLSDLAAMGAQPVAFTLALALPEARASWLEAFAAGLYTIADRFECELVGGDTTRGPLTVSITVMGELPSGVAIRRDGARAGDDLWVSGTLGGAALGLMCLRQSVRLSESDAQAARMAQEQPLPRVALGLALRELVHSMIDVSDGLVGDLGHIAASSGVAAHVDVDALPLAPVLREQALKTRLSCALAGGDDYELCFTAARARRAAILAVAHELGTPVTRIGCIEAGEGVHFEDAARYPYSFPAQFKLQGFDHFA